MTQPRVPITRLNKFFSEEDFDLDISMGEEWLGGDMNFTLVLYRVDKQKTNNDDVYGETLSDGIQFLAPIEFKGSNKIEEVVFSQNKVENGKVVESGVKFSIKCGLVISAIGYDSVEYPGITIENGRINNIAGHVEHNLYTTGWAKRGPTGVIGTNKSDSTDVVELIIENLKEPKLSEGITSLLKSGHEVIDQLAWEKINASEVISGEIAGKPRVKEVDWKRLISLGRS